VFGKGCTWLLYAQQEFTDARTRYLGPGSIFRALKCLGTLTHKKCSWRRFRWLTL